MRIGLPFVIIAVSLTVAGSAALLMLAGVSAYRIASGSMEPQFPVGSVVVDVGGVRLEPGRAFTFTADGHTVTHVFVGYEPDGSLITRGTANDSNDDWPTPVYPRDVRGRVVLGLPFFAPSFWSFGRIAAVVGGAVVVVCAYILRPIPRGTKTAAYSPLHSSSK